MAENFAKLVIDTQVQRIPSRINMEKNLKPYLSISYSNCLKS
jgi:hypothetical protein